MQSAISEATREARPWWSWLVPSLSQWLWLMLLLVLLAQPWRTMMVASDGDACMHWRVGEWMLEHRQIIHADVFSHTRFGQPIVSKEWLSEIVFAVAGRLGGLYGIAVFGALLIVTTFALLHRQLLRDGNDVLVATTVVLLAACASSMHWLARPHAFSFLMMALWNDTLRRFERTGSMRKLMVALGVLTVLWVNLHGAYLAGFLVLGAYWLAAVIQKDRAKLGALTTTAASCAVLSLLNPNGYELHLHNLQFLHSAFFKNWLAEYASMRFDSPDALGFLFWLGMIFLILALRRPRLTMSEALLLISWTYFALYSARNVPLLAILSAPILASALSEAVPVRWQMPSQKLRAMNEAARSWVVSTILAVMVVVIPRPTEMPSKDWPTDALAFIKTHDQQFAGNMFNQYAWGGYLMQYLPEHKVFVDGRADFYGENLLREFSDTTALHTNWTQVVQKYDVRWTLMPTDHRLNLALALLPGWERAYADKVATIYCRNPHPDPWSPLAPPAAGKPLPSTKGEGNIKAASSPPSFGGEERGEGEVPTALPHTK
jgi:hypothetical protein